MYLKKVSNEWQKWEWINIQRMNDTRNVTKNRQQDVDEEIGIAATLQEDTKRWQDDGEDDLDDVAAEKSISKSSSDKRGV